MSLKKKNETGGYKGFKCHYLDLNSKQRSTTLRDFDFCGLLKSRPNRRGRFTLTTRFLPYPLRFSVTLVVAGRDRKDTGVAISSR